MLENANDKSTRPSAIVHSVSNERENNFDLIRLIAASQVAVSHGINHFDVTFYGNAILNLIPGVPIFFCISGFLIAKSAERNLDTLSNYIRSRALRIYPALFFCTSLSAVVMYFLGVFNGIAPLRILSWYLSCIVAGGASINPQFLRQFGVGVWNGSLWTISVELSFYALLPVILLVTRRLTLSLTPVLCCLIGASYGSFILADGIHFGESKTASVLEKVVWFSIIGNLWMFLLGTLTYQLRDRVLPMVKDRFLWWLFAYATFCIGIVPLLGGAISMEIVRLFLTRCILAMLTLSAAFSFRSISGQLLGGNDISYGVYLWHMPVYNCLIHLGLIGVGWYIAGLAVAFCLAAISWFYLERRLLKFKP